MPYGVAAPHFLLEYHNNGDFHRAAVGRPGSVTAGRSVLYFEFEQTRLRAVLEARTKFCPRSIAVAACLQHVVATNFTSETTRLIKLPRADLVYASVRHYPTS
jgi:hypothetical protein